MRGGTYPNVMIVGLHFSCAQPHITLRNFHELLEEKFGGERDKDFRGMRGNCRCLFACEVTLLKVSVVGIFNRTVLNYR